MHVSRFPFRYAGVPANAAPRPARFNPDLNNDSTRTAHAPRRRCPRPQRLEDRIDADCYFSLAARHGISASGRAPCVSGAGGIVSIVLGRIGFAGDDLGPTDHGRVEWRRFACSHGPLTSPHSRRVANILTVTLRENKRPTHGS